MSSARFSICIPAWQAETFLDRAIDCALNQTLDDLELIISVDGSTDRTAEVALDRARSDDRVRVFVHSERVGWTRNVNTALDQVRGEFFCLFPHDDYIAPNYLARLHSVLKQSPNAGSACGGVRICLPDGEERVTIGRSFDESPPDRMARSLIGTERGAILRALTRRRLLSSRLRLPEGSPAGFQANAAYVFELVAAAPCIQIPDILYVREAQRPSGLVKSWNQISRDDLVQDLARVSAAILASIKTHAPPSAIPSLTAAAQIEMGLRLTKAITERGLGSVPAPSELHPDFSAAGPDIDSLAPQWRSAGQRREARRRRLLNADPP